MSRDTKYIGMDVHKEATVIAVLNGSGKLVMESIVETEASSILQFIHGLRGELQESWELTRPWALGTGAMRVGCPIRTPNPRIFIKHESARLT